MFFFVFKIRWSTRLKLKIRGTQLIHLGSSTLKYCEIVHFGIS